MTGKTPRNKLLVYRKRLGLSQKRVASLLGHSDTSMLSRYENGRALPTLAGALRLEIVYRVPVAFLFEGLYERGFASTFARRRSVWRDGASAACSNPMQK